MLAAEIGVLQPVAIDERVIADQQRTADRYQKAGVIRARLDASRVFDLSFNESAEWMSSSYGEADVLVLGGRLSATWAAAAAAAAGASVVLADKGFCGTSGVTATAGPGHWWVSPEPGLREAAIREREGVAEGLAERAWMTRILDGTWRTLPALAPHYAFPRNEAGVTQYRNMRGPEYMRAMRRLVRKSGVRIKDGSPALERLLHGDGSVAGARGIDRVTGVPWMIRAGAVVLATGGCAFMSRLLGCHTNTGDGALMAVEAGASLSGMEFSAHYTVAPAFSTMTRSMFYAFATYTDAAGRELDIPQGRAATEALARAMQAGPVFCSLARMPQHIRDRLIRMHDSKDWQHSATYSGRHGSTIAALIGSGTDREVASLAYIGRSGRASPTATSGSAPQSRPAPSGVALHVKKRDDEVGHNYREASAGGGLQTIAQ